MPERFRVRLDKEYHVFSASHFITFQGDVCEQLHGHNYRVAVEVDGPLDENHYVVDFIALRDALKAVTDDGPPHAAADRAPADPGASRRAGGGSRVRRPAVGVSSRPAAPCWRCPTRLPNCSPAYLGLRLLDDLHRRLGFRPERLEVAVDESNGQWGVWELRSSRLPDGT